MLDPLVYTPTSICSVIPQRYALAASSRKRVRLLAGCVCRLTAMLADLHVIHDSSNAQSFACKVCGLAHTMAACGDHTGLQWRWWWRPGHRRRWAAGKCTTRSLRLHRSVDIQATECDIAVGPDVNSRRVNHCNVRLCDICFAPSRSTNGSAGTHIKTHMMHACLQFVFEGYTGGGRTDY